MPRLTRLATALILGLAACTTSAASSAQPSVRPSATAPQPDPTPSAEVAVACAPRSLPFDAAHLNLPGAWAGDDDGIYYLRLVDRVLWWNGMSDRAAAPLQLGRGWNNVGRGQVKADLTIVVEWADVPRGDILGHGTLNLKVEKDSKGNVQLRKTSEIGDGFGNTLWTPCTPG